VNISIGKLFVNSVLHLQSWISTSGLTSVLENLSIYIGAKYVETFACDSERKNKPFN